MAFDSQTYSGMCSYRDIDFTFVFYDDELRLIPPADKRETGELSLQKLLDDAGITLDFGICGDSAFAFAGSNFTHIGQLDFSKLRNASDPNRHKDMFESSLRLKTIEKLILPETSGTSYLRWFRDCPALENLTLEGIVYTNFSVADSPLLTHASLMNIINCLEMKNGETFTCTLGTENLAKLTDAEKAIATEKGWTLA